MDKTDKLEACPTDLIAFKWAETLSTGEQSVLLTSSLKRLQTMIDSSASVAAPPPDTLNEPCGYCNGTRKEVAGYDGRIVPCAYCTGDQAALHWPFTPKHDNCIECAREYEPPPSPVAAIVDAETPPFLLDDVVQQLNRVLDLLESIEDHSGKMSVQEPLPKARVILRGLIGHCAASASTARHYSCSCGGALTAEEYIEHYFEEVHDRGDPTVRFQAAAEIVKAWLWHTPEHDQERARTSIAAILSNHLGSAAVGEQLSDAAVERKAVLELIERFQREPQRSQATINALEWLRRQIAEGNHVYHKFTPPTVGFLKPEECTRCGMPGNALMHLLAAATPTSTEDKQT